MFGSPSKTILLSLGLLSCSVSSQSINWTASPFVPSAIPLAVRSPYLAAYLPAGTNDQLGDLSSQWASFWNGNYLPWCGGALVDGQPFTFMGTPGLCIPGKAEQQSVNFTASQSIFIMRAGTVDLTVKFLSPITPKDLTRQSMPYSYLSITAASIDGQSHDVQIYTDIGSEWLSGADTTQNVSWTTQLYDSGLHVHEASLLEKIPYAEIQDYSRDATVVYATNQTDSTTYKTGGSRSVRDSFVANRALDNQQDTAFRQIDDDEPVFAFARDLGSISSTTSEAVVFVIGSYHSPAINWTASPSANSNRELYFMEQYPSLNSSLSYFYEDYSESLRISNTFDLGVQDTAVGLAGEKYAALCALAARQVFGGIEISIGLDAQGNYNTSDVMVFAKEIATSNYIQTLDVIYPSIPFFLYYDEDFVGYLLEPLLRFTATGVYPHAWASHNLGWAYPNATGHPDGSDPAYYIEESGNSLIMAMAYARAANDNSQLGQYYDVLKGWANYLVEDSYYPRQQASTDDFQGSLANQTNLAVKGTLGLRCMSEIASRLGRADDAINYLNVAQNYSNHIIVEGLSTDGSHLKLAFDQPDDTWSTLYNLYPDVLFGYSLFPESLYDTQARWYGSIASQYGVPLDSRNANVKSDWEIQMAAALSSTNTTARDLFIDGLYSYLEFGSISQALPDMYQIDGSSTAFVGRPVVGAIFALLAQNKMPQS